MARTVSRRTNSSSLTDDRDQLFLMMAAALGQKDRYTQDHAQRVSTYAQRLAVRLKLLPEDVYHIAVGGMLHDVGKLALSDRLFHRQEVNLTREQWNQVRSHPLIGAALLEQLHGRGMIYDAILYHHERLDGSGYPFGLQGFSIPLCARIVSVADCFDAITTDRPYQKRKCCRDALKILVDIAGSALDAELVAAFMEDIQSKGMIPAFNAGRRKKINYVSIS